jgi:hypothetical protein
MARATLARRIERLEAATGGGDVTLEELIWWSTMTRPTMPICNGATMVSVAGARVPVFVG